MNDGGTNRQAVTGTLTVTALAGKVTEAGTVATAILLEFKSTFTGVGAAAGRVKVRSRATAPVMVRLRVKNSERRYLDRRIGGRITRGCGCDADASEVNALYLRLRSGRGLPGAIVTLAA